MALGWNEVKERAVRFYKEWKDTLNELIKSNKKCKFVL